MAKVYHYVGPTHLIRSEMLPVRYRIVSPSDADQWIHETKQEPGMDGGFIATFVIDTRNQIWIADRCSEHVHCARYGNVLSAGEITFLVEKKHLYVSAVTNQSTGFCPEPDSWAAVDAALQAARLDHPDSFTTAFDFRRCPSCRSINIIKETYFICSVCDADLPADWNFE